MSKESSVIISRQSDVINMLIELNRETIKLLSEYMACEEYEEKLKNIILKV